MTMMLDSYGKCRITDIITSPLRTQILENFLLQLPKTKSQLKVQKDYLISGIFFSTMYFSPTDSFSLSSCGDKYVYFGWQFGGLADWEWVVEDVTWNWFQCKRTRKCITQNSRCDLHPHPDCIYRNKNGDMVAEDEEDCFEEYKKKNLVVKSAHFECQSAIHNSNAEEILSTVYNESGGYEEKTVIPQGILVQIQATQCDGITECWNDKDEKNC